MKCFLTEGIEKFPLNDILMFSSLGSQLASNNVFRLFWTFIELKEVFLHPSLMLCTLPIQTHALFFLDFS